MLKRLHARNLLVAAFAGGGVLAAHWLGYRSVSHGDHHHEVGLLRSTGHDWFVYVIAAVAALSALLMWRYVSHRIEERQSPEVSGVRLFAQAAVRLIPLQGIAFLALEAAERVVSSGTLPNLFSEPAVLMGLFFQVVVGIAGAILVAAFAGAVEAIRRRGTTLAAKRAVVRVYPKEVVFEPSGFSLAEGGLGLRGPPSLL